MPGCNQRIFIVMIELPTATPPLAMTAAYKETYVTIRIRSNRYYSAEYRIAVHPTIRPRSEYEANIRYSPNIYIYIYIYISIIYFLRLIPQVGENGAAREPCQRRRHT